MPNVSHYHRVPYRRNCRSNGGTVRVVSGFGTADDRAIPFVLSAHGACSCVGIINRMLDCAMLAQKPEALRPAEVRNLDERLVNDVLVCPWCSWGYVLIPVVAV